MIQNKASLEVKIGDRLYQFICDHQSAISEVGQVLNLMWEHVKKIEEAKAADAPPPPEESKE